MSPEKKAKDVAASVRARLLDVSRRRHVEFQQLLSEFAIERLLYRLGISPYAERFVLKGAILFKAWSGVPHRATWDLDLFGRGAGSVPEVVAVIRDVCMISVGDGIVFDEASITGEEIRAADDYVGVRVRLEAHLAGARIPMQVDIGFGGAIAPGPTRQSFPTLLDHPAPRILTYPREAVVAEKLEAMLSLGVTNSRMKDFYDVYLLASSFAFEGSLLVRAVRAVFKRRRTPLPGSDPLVLTREFLAAPERQTLWRALLRRGRLDAPPETGRLADALREFLIPVLEAAARGEEFAAAWRPGGPWRSGRPEE
jgi:hypothetical protein